MNLLPPKSNDEGALEQKMRHYGIIEMGEGRGGQDVPFILPKIVVVKIAMFCSCH